MDSYGARLAVSAVAGGTTSAITGGSFSDGAVTATYVTMFNHFAHKIEDNILINRIRENGFSPINLSENPYKGTVEGFKIARLYNRGKLPELNALFPDGMRIQDLFDMSSITVGTGGWSKLSGEKIGDIYYYKHKNLSIRLDSRSFYIGDVITNQPYKLILYDNSKYWTAHEIAWIHYNNNFYNYWLKAVSFINNYN